jgi:hypothetical protein
MAALRFLLREFNQITPKHTQKPPPKKAPKFPPTVPPIKAGMPIRMRIIGPLKDGMDR